jgi:hypothetical protein
MPIDQRLLFRNLTYVDSLKQQITNSGGTIVFMKDNIIVASEISEAQYRQLLNNPYIEKLDVLPLKRYANDGVKFEKNEIDINTIDFVAKIDNTIPILPVVPVNSMIGGS